MAPAAYKTCDVCRKRKTKCIPPTDDNEQHDANAPCTNCTRLGITCTYDHKYKKPGRPSTFAKAASAATDGGGPSSGSDDQVAPDGRSHSPGVTRPTTGQAEMRSGLPELSGVTSGSLTDATARRRYSETVVRSPENVRSGALDPHRPGGPGNGHNASSNTIANGTHFPSYAPSTNPAPTVASASTSAPYTGISYSASSLPFGPIPNSLAPPVPLPHTVPHIPTPLPVLDAFDFASAFHGYDDHDHDHDHDHEDGVENDLAIDWPTMSSGNGALGHGAQVPGAGAMVGNGGDGMSVPASGDLASGVGGNASRGRGAPSGFSPSQQNLMTYGPTGGSGPGPNGQAVPAFTLQPPSSTASSIPRPRVRDRDRDFQIEDIVPWHTISFFITIYLGYSHSLFPMVHRPSFSQKLALRADKRDKDFRALVLGIVAYSIGQSPLSRMTSSFTRPELSALQHRCHRGSMMLLDRSFKNPNVLQVATLSAGYFYCQSVGKTTRALTLLSEACQLMHLLHMHDDEVTAGLGLDAVEIQMRRRIWWHVYAVDITEASAGQMIHLNSFEGQPAFPSEIDDEYLTAQGSFPQPPSHTSYIVGLVACVRLFPVLEQVLVRSRTLRTRIRQQRYMSAAEVVHEVDWIASANAEVDGIMNGLPDVLKMGWTIDEDMDEVRLAVMGMQRANMAITAVSIRFALADYRAELEPQSHAADADRANMGREAYHTLSIIPLDDLAANGESMRGKIFRILLALLKSNSDSTDWVTTLQDWWTLFSRVQFVQLMTSNVESRLPSPEPGAAA